MKQVEIGLMEIIKLGVKPRIIVDLINYMKKMGIEVYSDYAKATKNDLCYVLTNEDEIIIIGKNDSYFFARMSHPLEYFIYLRKKYPNKNNDLRKLSERWIEKLS